VQKLLGKPQRPLIRDRGALPGETEIAVRDAPLELCVVVPTFNEADNIARLIERLAETLAGIAWEAVVVDDESPDGTAEVVRRIARSDRRVRIMKRMGRRGLSSACMEGMLATAAPHIAVIDADFQHDEALLPAMLETLRGEDLDLVVGSRFVAGGGTGSWSAQRLKASRLATWVSRLLANVDLKDPMSGYFIIRREALDAAMPHVSGIGFKILLDLVASSPRPLRIRELPYEFRERRAGESKLDLLTAWQFLMMLWDKRLGRLMPARFVSFSVVGAFGVAVHFVILSVLYRTLGADFVASQAAAAVGAMTGNFLLNNLLTYRDQRLRGREMLRGWLTFTLACSVGAIANVGIAAALFRGDIGWFLSALAGVVVGAVWNYAATSFYTWRRG
jgi:dolichol-phosphate mannosyltransferase